MRKKHRSSSQQHQEGRNKGQQGGRPARTQPGPKPGLRPSSKPNKSAAKGPKPAMMSAISLPRDAVLAWGRHAVEAAIKNPKRKIVSIYASPDTADVMRGMIQDNIAASRQPSFHVMDKPQLADAVASHLPIDEKAVHQGVVAVLRPLDHPSLDDWLDTLDDQRSVIMILDQITDARNIGAMMRSARAFRADAIITTDKHCPPETGVMLRTASGAAEHIPLIKVVNLSRGIEKLQNHHFMIAGMTAAGNTPIRSLADHDRLGIVMGAEGKGLRRLTEERADILVRIPIDDDAESLNVSNAAAVALFAAQREDD